MNTRVFIYLEIFCRFQNLCESQSIYLPRLSCLAFAKHKVHTHIHTYTHIYIYSFVGSANIYIYMYMQHTRFVFGSFKIAQIASLFVCLSYLPPVFGLLFFVFFYYISSCNCTPSAVLQAYIYLFIHVYCATYIVSRIIQLEN